MASTPVPAVRRTVRPVRRTAGWPVTAFVLATLLVGLTPLSRVPALRLAAAVGAVAFVCTSHRAMTLAGRPRAVVALMGIAGVSSVLGPNPSQALRGFTGMVAEIAAGASVAAFTLRVGTPRSFHRACHWLLILAIAVAVAEFVRTGHVPWSSPLIFTAKNEAGLLAAFTLATLVDGVRRARSWAVACWAVVLLSGSRAALVAIVAATLVRWIARSAYIGDRAKALQSRLPAVGMVTVAVGVAVVLRAEIVATLGRSPDLTGRTEIWPVVWDSIRQRPLLGGGPGGLIYDGSDLALAIERTFGRALWTTQSGYLSVVLSLGVVGAGIFLAVMVAHVRSIDRHRLVPAHTRQVEAALSTLVIYLVMNLTEDVALGHTGLFFLTYSMGRLNGLARARQ